MPGFLRERVQAYLDNIVAALLGTGGAVAIGLLINHFAPLWGVDPRVALVLAWLGALVVLITISLLLKPKKRAGHGSHRVPELPRSEINANPIISPTISPSVSQTVSPHIQANPHNEFKPHIEVSIDNRPLFQQSQGEMQQSEATSNPDPVFECEDDPRVVIYGIDWRTKQLIRQTPTPEELSQLPEYITAVNAVLAPFYYRPDRGVEHTLYLSAHITFFTRDRRKLRRVIAGIWDGNPLKSSTHIQTGRSLELLICLVPLGCYDWLFSAEYHQEILEGYWGKESYDAPRLERVEGKQFLIKVDLVPKKISKVPFPVQAFWFKLLLDIEPRLTRIDSPELEN